MEQTYNGIIGYGMTNTRFVRVRNLTQNEMEPYRPHILPIREGLAEGKTLAEVKVEQADNLSALITDMCAFIEEHDLTGLSFIAGTRTHRLLIRVSAHGKKVIVPTEVSDEAVVIIDEQGGHSYLLMQDKRPC